MRKRLVLMGLVTVVAGLIAASSVAQAVTAPSNCTTVSGPGYFSQACGDHVEVSGGPGSSAMASSGNGPVTTTIVTASTFETAVPQTVVSQVVPSVPTIPTPAPRPAPVGILGALLRLLGLG